MKMSIAGKFVEHFPKWFDDTGVMILNEKGITIAHKDSPRKVPYVWNPLRKRWDALSWRSEAERREVLGDYDA